MMQITMKGLHRVQQRIQRYGQELMPKIDSDIFFVGEAAKSRLKQTFQDLNIVGEFYPSTHTYVLRISFEEGELKWLFCDKWHTYFKRERDQTTTRQEMKSDVPNLKKAVIMELEKISRELISKINTSIKYLK